MGIRECRWCKLGAGRGSDVGGVVEGEFVCDFSEKWVFFE